MEQGEPLRVGQTGHRALDIEPTGDIHFDARRVVGFDRRLVGIGRRHRLDSTRRADA